MGKRLSEQMQEREKEILVDILKTRVLTPPNYLALATLYSRPSEGAELEKAVERIRAFIKAIVSS